MAISKAQFQRDLAKVTRESPYRVIEAFRDEAGSHPETYRNWEQAFAAKMISRKAPKSILDIGSNRHFVNGLLAAFKVTTLDVRTRSKLFPNETLLVGDAKKFDLPDNSFDLVLSLSAIEHFGLGRYGDELDLQADTLAVKEMIRVLRPGGWLVFTTEIHRAKTVIRFNADRIYSREHITSWFKGSCVPVHETYCIGQGSRWSYGPYKAVISKAHRWQVYCGCWEKS